MFQQFRNYLLWIEHGSYSKSYKLITLRALGQINGVTAGASIREISALARWMVFRDTDLIADLADTSSAFADPMNPTSTEWEAYWRKNPINALTTATRGADAWFMEDSDWLRPNFDVPETLRSTFETMTQELVDYRLHRYLLSQSSRRTGEVRRPLVEGRGLDATFAVEGTGPVATSVVIESAGGAGEQVRNGEYVLGVDVVLARLAGLGVRLMDAYIDTRRVAELSVADRRLDPGDDRSYPIALSEVSDLTALRSNLLRSMATAGRAPGVTGGGNSRKRFRLVIALPTAMSPTSLADALATGDEPPDAAISGRTDRLG